MARWRKSSYSNANDDCIEVALGWVKSSYSNDGDNCVEVALDSLCVGVRDSKDVRGGELYVPAASWGVLTQRLGR